MSEDKDDRISRRRRRDPFWGFRSWGFSDDLFEEMEKRFEEMIKEMENSIPRELVRERRLPDGRVSREMGPFIYGYSLTMGPDGKPIIREFGNVRPQEKGRIPFEVTERREPLVDIIEEGKDIRVIAEIPGVEKEEIKVEFGERSLAISVEKGRKYFKTVSLPSEVSEQGAKATYRNGVLEIILRKVHPSRPSGRSLEVE